MVILGEQITVKVVYHGVDAARLHANLRTIDRVVSGRTAPDDAPQPDQCAFLPLSLAKFKVLLFTLPVAAPAEARDRIMARLDGVVLVAGPDRESTRTAVDVLRTDLATFARRDDMVPLCVLVQRDPRDGPFEELVTFVKRALATDDVTCIDARPDDSAAVMETLKAIAKRVLVANRR